jgi:hypothetical protein
MEDHAGELVLQDAPDGGAMVSLVFAGGATQAAKRRVGPGTSPSKGDTQRETEVVVHGA